MNLNEGILDEFSDSSLIDNDLVKLPGSVKEPVNAITIIATDDPMQGGNLVPKEVIEKLPELDVTLKVITDGQEKVLTLKEVQDEILSDNSISKESAQYVQSSFSTLFDGPIKLHEFTEGKSKTNFDYVTRHMRRTITTEEIAIASNIQLLLSTPLAEAKSTFDCLLKECIPAVIQQCQDMQSFVVSHVEAIMQSKDVVFPYSDNTFVNIKTTDFTTIDATKFDSMDSVVRNQMTALGLLFKDPALTTFIHCVKDNCAVTEAVSEEFHPTYSGSDITGEDLLKFYSVSIDTYIEYLQELCETQLKFLNGLSDNSSTYIESPEVMNAFLAESLPAIQTAFATLRRSIKMVNNISVLNFNASGYIKFLSLL